MSTTPSQHSADIDRLLEQYLLLLDTYTSLQTSLSLALSSIHQHIARADFSSPNPRGTRYGSEAALYAASTTAEARAECVLRVEQAGDSIAGVRFCVVDSLGDGLGDEEGSGSRRDKVGTRTRKATMEDQDEEDERGDSDSDIGEGEGDASSHPDPSPRQETETPKEAHPHQHPPPLRLFPILPPASLRAARTESAALVRHLVPRLAQVEVEMREVEVCVRRARKKIAKAKAGGGGGR